MMKNKSVWTPSYRLVIFVPEQDMDAFMKAVSAHIPSFMGPYDHVAWWSEEGVEQFRALEGAQPAQGMVGQVERDSCRRVELSLPYDQDMLDRFVQAVILPSHPWEKPVIYIYNAQNLA
tara:strand:- start:648 stop:1004 length:357 start_codon:yes stop_codon:yes gene_type:complete